MLKKTIFRNIFAPLILPLMSILIVIGLATTGITPAYAYSTVARWSGNSTEWRSYISGSPFPSNSTSLIASAGQKWSQSSTGKNFTFYNYQNVPGPTRVAMYGINFPAYGLPDSAPATTALTVGSPYISSAIVYMNTTWTWNTSCTLNQAQKKADFRVIILHELGHAVALNHDASHTEAVMWPNWTCKTNLAQDDKNGIGALYP